MADKVILIAGNICSGKTTLINYIEENKDKFNKEVKTFIEFIDPICLNNFYNDRKNHSAWFEESCLNGRIARYFTAKKSKGVVFLDRGIIEGADIFCRNSYETGYLKWDRYRRYDENLRIGLDDLDRTEQDKWLEKLIIYLKIKNEDMESIYERNIKRNTAGEKISLDYLKEINNRYKEFIEINLSKIYGNYGLNPPEILSFDSVKFNKEYIFNKILNKIC